MFLVAPGDQGVTVLSQQMTDGDAAGRLELAGVELPADRVLGNPAAGAEITDWLVSRGTVGLCALQLGVLERALELTSEYAQEPGRSSVGRSAASRRWPSASPTPTSTSRRSGSPCGRPPGGCPRACPATTEVATAKFWAADAGHRVAHTAVHVHGGVGVDTGHPLHRYFVAAKRLEFALGGATTQLRRIGAALARAAEPSWTGTTARC